MRVERVRKILGSSIAIFLGATVGAAARIALANLQQPDAGIPWVTFAINASGAFLLGFLLEYLACLGDDTGGRRLARLALGTGALGGFTTYGSFVIEVDSRLAQGDPMIGIGYAAMSLVAGIACAWLGSALATFMAHRFGPAVRGEIR